MTTVPPTSAPLDEAGRCAVCRFDAAAYPPQDIAGTARALDTWWALALEEVDPGAVAVVTGLTAGTADLVSAARRRAEALLDRLATATGGATAPDRSLASVHDDLHAELHEVQRVARAVARLPIAPSRHEGRVEGVFTSGGGVPKRSVGEAVIGYRGMLGDRQSSRVHHGRVWQALCLYSAEAIARLRAEGHPILAGAAGENVNLSGVEWAALRPGTRLRIGPVLAEVTLPALPCKKNAQWFRDGDFRRMHHETHRGETRWYASVLEDGTVRPGDVVVVEP